MTNADRIRNMTDEELAAWLEKIIMGGCEAFDAWTCDHCLQDHGGSCPWTNDSDCCDKVDSDVLLWLRSSNDTQERSKKWPFVPGDPIN